MDTSQVKTYFSSLSQSNQEHLLKSLSSIQIESDYTELLQLRGDALDDKRSECPHCQSPNYYKNGKDKGSSLHSRMKTFFNYNMRAVSTKYRSI